MVKIFTVIAIVSAALFSLSCNELSTSPSSSQGQLLTASENPVFVAQNYSTSVKVTGGKGTYRVKSITDSSIVQLFLYPTNPGTASFAMYVNIQGMKLGTTKIVIQDSAKTAEVEIGITVVTFAASPSNVKVKVNRTSYVSILGGKKPYVIELNANPSIAAVTFDNYFMTVRGVAEGTTSVTIRDDSNPTNKVTVPIEVIAEPKFTTAGQITFSSNIGNFSANGIYSIVNNLPASDEGAGGMIYLLGSSGNLCTITGYKKKSGTLFDAVTFGFLKKDLSAGTLAIDTNIFQIDTAIVMFIFNGDITTETGDMYRLTSGSLTFNTLTTQHATGTFNGSGVLFRNDVIIPGNNASVTNGLFDVPMLLEDPGLSPSVKNEDKRIKAFVQKMVEREFKRIQSKRN
ncbi:MAG: hypothetical protein WDA22_01060 [Bacteroidota bacterium]